MLYCSRSDVSLNFRFGIWKHKMRPCNGKLPRKLLDVLTVTSKIRGRGGAWTGSGMHEVSGTNMGPFWNKR